jgi:RNA polymerase sigma factor for flagellar operon FliA
MPQTTRVDDLVREAMPLVGYVVTEIISRLPAHVRREDLESAGYEALVRCARSYDWASRGARRAERQLSNAEDRLTQELGRQPSSAELAADLGFDGSDLLRTRERVQRAAVLSLNAIVGESDVDLATQLVSPDLGQEERLLSEERTRVLHAAVEALPDRLRQVVTDYFLGEKPMAEIAAEMGVGESRISQMRAQALELLREGLNRHLEGIEPTAAPEPGVAARRREEYYSRVAALSGVHGRQNSAPADHPSYVSALA